ncbi:MAG: NAD(P)H-dependent oxidoreductase [Candidatus Doudnabacteria bacterium]|nr:NAD(P)H-dependent oxidoreductase [Candidatus Doudnabacteria bacterium]
MLNIPVVLGSVREKRNSYFPAKLMLEKVKGFGAETQLVDFKETPLPFFDSPLTPSAMKGVYPYKNVQLWSEVATAADGFIIVTPEYNHGYPAIVKNALDWLYKEFEKKPFGLVGVSDGSYGGARAIEQLRPIIENFGAFAIRETVNFTKAPSMFDESGNLIEVVYLKRIDNFLQNLFSFAEVMKPIRPKLSRV